MFDLTRKYGPAIVGIGLMLALNAATGACRHNAQPSSPASAPVAEERGTVALSTLRAAILDEGGAPAPSALWIADSGRWRGLFERDAAPPEVDFDRYGVLLVRMGEKPTGGYGLRLLSDVAGVDGRTATVPIEWREPAPGSVTTQAITSPRLLVLVEKGAFDDIAVVDQNGAVRLRLPL
ncbi:MAG: protease complex subunit PrcB family protein [Acidobacteriota bacterium]|jgi:hypothetical protein|nr:protease complex subunit PrcB family protein [Acidobacteriota bacterium]